MDAESGNTAKLKVSHPKQGNVMGRGLKLWLDDMELAPVRAGQILTVETAPGHHQLRVSNTYHEKVVDFEAAPGELIHYRINNKPGFFGWFLLTVLGGGPMYLTIERDNPRRGSDTPA